jgi:4-amino-4-deoxy-L-arabinose transferase-like glycosyltransferase
MTDAELAEPHLVAKHNRLDLIGISLAAFLIRLAWVVFGSWESNDSQWYLATARNLIRNRLFSADGIRPTAYRPPLYSSLIAAVWFGESEPVRIVLVVQVLLGTLTVALVYLIARKHASRTIALIASAGLALAPMTGRFTAVILTETLFTLLVTLGVFWWSRQQYVLSGVAFGLGILTRVTLLPFVVILVLLTLLRPWKHLRRDYLTIALVALAICSIWIVRNAVVFHRFIPVAASGYGTNLLIGSMSINDADNVVRRKAILNSIDSAGGVTSSDETEFDRVRLRGALKIVTEDPLRWLAVRARQYPRLFIDSGSYLFGDEGVPLASAFRQGRIGQVLIRIVMVLGNILVFLLALPGIISRRDRVIAMTEILLFPIFLAIVALPLWIEPRYGLPMMPLIAILSAMGAGEIWTFMKARFAGSRG